MSYQRTMDALIPVASSAGLLSSVLLGLIVIVVLWHLAVYLRSPLRKFPGPFLAGRENFNLISNLVLLSAAGASC